MKILGQLILGFEAYLVHFGILSVFLAPTQ